MTDSLQLLLSAERKAMEKVTEARKRRMKRVTQANVEANIEIEMYQSKMEKHFQEFENKFKESFEGIAAKIVADTDAFIIKMLEGAQKNKELVIQELLNIIFEVKPEIHRNYYFLSTYE